MLLYSRTGATAVDDPDFGHFEAAEDGSFDLPPELGNRLHAYAIAGVPQWENSVERQRRLMAEEAERRKDPATLLAAVEQLVNAAKNTAEDAPDPEPKKAPARRPRKTTPKTQD